jgi:hypothetical protein
MVAVHAPCKAGSHMSERLIGQHRCPDYSSQGSVTRESCARQDIGNPLLPRLVEGSRWAVRDGRVPTGGRSGMLQRAPDCGWVRTHDFYPGWSPQMGHFSSLLRARRWVDAPGGYRLRQARSLVTVGGRPPCSDTPTFPSPHTRTPTALDHTHTLRAGHLLQLSSTTMPSAGCPLPHVSRESRSKYSPDSGWMTRLKPRRGWPAIRNRQLPSSPVGDVFDQGAPYVHAPRSHPTRQ